MERECKNFAFNFKPYMQTIFHAKKEISLILTRLVKGLIFFSPTANAMGGGEVIEKEITDVENEMLIPQSGKFKKKQASLRQSSKCKHAASTS